MKVGPSEPLDALLASPDRSTWIGRRDHALLVVAVQTGLRVSELTGLTYGDVELGTGAHVRCHGKGRRLVLGMLFWYLLVTVVPFMVVSWRTPNT